MRFWQMVEHESGARARYLFVGSASDGSTRVVLLPEGSALVAVTPGEFASGWKYAQTANDAPNSVAASVATPTQSMIRDLLSEADAILEDSSTEALMASSASTCSSTRMVSPSGATSTGLTMSPEYDGMDGTGGLTSPAARASNRLAKGLLLSSAIMLSFAVGLFVGRF